VVHQDAVANLGGLADHDPGAVVDDAAPSGLGGRVDLDAGDQPDER
jgi:hypothetical protein